MYLHLMFLSRSKNPLEKVLSDSIFFNFLDNYNRSMEDIIYRDKICSGVLPYIISFNYLKWILIYIKNGKYEK